MDIQELRKAIEGLRGEWRAVRIRRLVRKSELLAAGKDAAGARRDREVRELRRLQHRIAARILHLERRLNKKRAHETET